MKYLVMLFLVFTAVPGLSFAAEVKNLKVGQEGDKAVASYDLVGEKGEMTAGVTVAININGEVRTVDQLSLTGDFGKKVKVGKKKKIVWNAMKDLPSNFDGDIKWDVKSFSEIKDAKDISAKSGSEFKTEDKKDGPTLDETLEYIRNKVQFEYTADVNTGGNKSKIYSADTFEYNSCTIAIIRQLNDITVYPKIQYNISVSLDNINPETINVIHVDPSSTTSYDKDVWSVSFETINSEKLIKVVGPVTVYVKQSGFATASHDSAQRVAKALKHAVDLCSSGGGIQKKELF